MRYFQIPADVIIPAGPAKGTRILFRDTYRDAWLNNSQVFGGGGAAIRCAAKLEALIEGKEPGQWLEIEDADYNKLKESVASTQYVPHIAKYLLEFLDAVEEAVTKKPAHLAAPSADEVPVAAS